MKEEEENEEKVSKVQIEEIEVEEDELKDEKEETKLTTEEENIVYIFSDEGVDEEVVLDSQSTEQGNVFIVGGDEFIFINADEDDETDDDVIHEYKKEEIKDLGVVGETDELNEEDDSWRIQQIKSKRVLLSRPAKDSSDFQVVRRRQVQLFARDQIVEPQFCPDYFCEEVVLADTQEKRSSGKRRRTGKIRTTADRSGPLPAIKPKTDDQGFANHETVFIDPESNPGRILVAFSQPQQPPDPLNSSQILKIQPRNIQTHSPNLQTKPKNKPEIKLAPKQSPNLVPKYLLQNLAPKQSIHPVQQSLQPVQPVQQPFPGVQVQIQPSTQQTNMNTTVNIQDKFRTTSHQAQSPYSQVSMKIGSNISEALTKGYPRLKQIPSDKHRWLWQFMKELFNRNDPCFRWQDESIGKFYLEDIGRLGKLWENYKQLKNIRAQSWRQMRYYFGFYEENRIIRQIPEGEGYIYQFQELFYKDRFVPYKYKPIKDFSLLESLALSKYVPSNNKISRPGVDVEKLWCERGCGSQFKKSEALNRHQTVCTFS
ncbi:uncharacterized protein LOC111701150 [Eurytemora carolleeae]|uniref:uncharacterized protein LOC111701150 n=1 Tax=Eurytemora carolleeae TaxID=1294199 RepID=UPI000C763756|nr:uncharacterized protein LOC111701150 [Eurytemora carolleeae]|eukprot:XP_023328086.1 uncharacterized protein LOC111701150 [Eurytemora affinis]